MIIYKRMARGNAHFPPIHSYTGGGDCCVPASSPPVLSSGAFGSAGLSGASSMADASYSSVISLSV
jgi:hypothetical protein